jgi:hypothetical protein
LFLEALLNKKLLWALNWPFGFKTTNSVGLWKKGVSG